MIPPRAWLLASLVLLGACGTPPRVERLSASWSDTAPTVLPGPDPAPETDRGRVAIVNRHRQRLSEERDRSEPTPFRGYAIYDPEGRLVLSCPDCHDDDTRLLPPGKYIAVGSVEYGLFDYEEKRVQLVVEPGRTTVVDFRRVAPAPVPEGAEAEPGSPQPGTGHSR